MPNKNAERICQIAGTSLINKTDLKSSGTVTHYEAESGFCQMRQQNNLATVHSVHTHTHTHTHLGRPTPNNAGSLSPSRPQTRSIVGTRWGE